ncbi:hypothetical protein K438DRAFT_1964652 [Mycena galopus ATCC 62051]|nr:hypothetical protein K438DRAFT_1964652 [Mycena galopus ATCC 62051]
MSHPFNDYFAGPSCSDIHMMPIQAGPAQSRSANLDPLPDISFDEFESSSPLSPSTSSSSSSCSDAPVTPYYQATSELPLPRVALLYTGLDPPVGGEYQEPVSPVAPAYEYEEWDEDEDATRTYSNVAIPESSLRSSVAHPDYDPNPAVLWACTEAAIAQFQYFDASPTSAPAPDPPTYATYLSSDPPPLHRLFHPTMHTNTLLRIQCQCRPQPRRSIPVVSLSALASASSENPSHSSTNFERAASPLLSPIELQSPSSHDVFMTSYSGLPPSADALPIAYGPRCPCPQCTDPYSIS